MRNFLDFFTDEQLVSIVEYTRKGNLDPVARLVAVLLLGVDVVVSAEIQGRRLAADPTRKGMIEKRPRGEPVKL